jgi:hypothetical protein
MGTLNTIIAEKSIEKNNHAYFEVEVDNNPKGSDVIIGLCNDKE